MLTLSAYGAWRQQWCATAVQLTAAATASLTQLDTYLPRAYQQLHN